MRYQIRCVCGHLSAFEIIPMPIEPSHRDKKISDEPSQRIAELGEENELLKCKLIEAEHSLQHALSAINDALGEDEDG
jgi:hypothetical protein